MIKKIISVLLVLALVGLAVFKIFFDSTDFKKELKDLRKDLTSYYMEANMEFVNGEDVRQFFVEVSYEKEENKDLFRVSLLDKGLNQEQILIRNLDGVYVLTPALNQVYEFESEWPLNNPKPYIYQSLLSVFDGDYEKKDTKDGYLITSKPKFMDNEKMDKQEIHFSKELKPISVFIYDNTNTVLVKVNFTKVDLNASFSENYFNVNENIKEARESSSSVSNEIELPLYPVNSTLDYSLKEHSTYKIGDTEVHIMTFEGNKPFTVIQKILEDSQEVVTLNLDGQIVDLINGFGIYHDGILTYSYAGVEYNIYSDVLTLSEMIDVANAMDIAGK